MTWPTGERAAADLGRHVGWAPYRLTAGQLLESAMVTSGAITNRIDRLVARGLVTREVDPLSRRPGNPLNP